MDQSWRLRAARQGDAEVVADLHIASRSLLDFLPSLHSAEETRAFFAGVLAEQRVTLAVEGDRLLGFLAEMPGWIHHLYVDPARIGQGIGSALLRDAQLRQRSLRLWCFQKNGLARRFYEHHGFRPAEFSDGAHNEEREPDVLYLWSRAR